MAGPAGRATEGLLLWPDPAVETAPKQPVPRPGAVVAPTSTQRDGSVLRQQQLEVAGPRGNRAARPQATTQRPSDFASGCEGGLQPRPVMWLLPGLGGPGLAGVVKRWGLCAEGPHTLDPLSPPQVFLGSDKRGWASGWPTGLPGQSQGVLGPRTPFEDPMAPQEEGPQLLRQRARQVRGPLPESSSSGPQRLAQP